MVNQETVFITGGAGFLGSYIASKLVAEGYKVVVYDAFIRYSNPFFDSKFLERQFQSRFQGTKDKVSLAIPRLQEMSKNSLNSVKQFYTPKSFYEKFMEAVQSV